MSVAGKPPNDASSTPDSPDIHEAQSIAVTDANAATCGDSKVVSLAAVVANNEAWKKNLIRSGKTGPIKKIITNILIALREAPELKDMLRFNGEALTVILDKRPPWEHRAADWNPRRWTDQDDKLLTEWLQRRGVDVTHKLSGDAVESVAQQHSFYPIKDYLESLVWDGAPRIGEWLTRYLGAESTEYTRTIGPRWLISAVARALNPGEKADCMLILEGPQGLGKSTALRALASPEFFTDEIRRLGDKDTLIGMAGAWIVEFADLEGFRGMHMDNLKAFISRPVDRFRPVYSRATVDAPRRCVFAGTTNRSNYLEDSTGNRRFWPVDCRMADIDALTQDRDQLWAEAAASWRAGARWWLDTLPLRQLALQEQEQRFNRDEWESMIEDYLFSGKFKRISISEILEGVFERTLADVTRSDQMRVAVILQRLGWSRKRIALGDMRVWMYVRDEPN